MMAHLSLTDEEEEEEEEEADLQSKSEEEVHKLPPSPTWRDYLLYLPLSIYVYALRVNRYFGWRFVVYLLFAQGMLKGLAFRLLGASILPLFKTYLGIDATRMQVLLVVTLIPWSIKPIIGLASDVLVICGYKRRPWLFLSLAIGVVNAGLIMLALSSKSIYGIVFCFMGVQFQLATFDLMTEAVYSGIMRENTNISSDIVTVVTTFNQVGGLVAIIIVGLLADRGLFYPLYTILACACLSPIVVTLAGWLPEEVGERRPYFRLAESESSESKKLMYFVIIFTGLAAPFTSLVSTTVDTSSALAFALAMTGTALVGAFAIFPKTIAKVVVYQVFVMLMRPNVGGALDYFYTATPDCLADGPNFSYSYYITYAGLVGTVVAILGTFFYQGFLSRMTFRNVFILTSILSGLIGTSDLFIILRINKMLGIPDQAAYMIGEAVMEPFLDSLWETPSKTIVSKAVLKGFEGSVYAFQAGMYNFALTISELSGSLVFEFAGVKTVPPCDFHTLWIIVLCCHAVGPLIGGVIGAIFLVPNVRQDRALDRE